MKQILILYIYTLPFVSAFAFTGTITLSLILSFFLLIFNIINFSLALTKHKKVPSLISYIFLLFFLSVLVISYLSFGIQNIKALNHLIAYTSVVFLFFINILFSFFFYHNKIKIEVILNAITLITFITCLFTIFEFLSYNLFDLDLNKYIFRPSRSDYNATSLGVIIRARGFSPESGHHALFLEILGPLSLYNILLHNKSHFSSLYKIVLVILLFANLVITYSTASYLAIGIAFILVILTNLFKFIKLILRNLIRPRSLLILSSILLFVFLIEAKFSVLLSVQSSIFQKLADNGSKSDREGRLVDFVNAFDKANIINKLIGFGPSGFSTVGLENSIISLYPTFVFESGLIGLFFFTMFLYVIFLHSLRIKSSIKYFIQFGFWASLIHYIFIGDYWYPWFWFLCAFTIFIFSSEKQSSIANV